MKKPPLLNNEIYHIYNRGVEKRSVFTDERDYSRFMRNLFEFNDANPVFNLGYRFFGNNSKPPLSKPRKPLVEILAFCAMPNHFHLLVKQLTDRGVTEFMRKLGTGYTNYFNQRHTRVGSLFQGTFKASLVDKEPQLLYLPHYIHLNPLDLTMPEWREHKIKDTTKALEFLKTYRWSSYLDYIGQKNFPLITQPAFYRSLTSIDYEKEMKEWLCDLEMEPIQNILID